MDSRQIARADIAPQQRRIEKPWGWEILWADSPFYSGKLIHARAGCRLSLQYHDDKTETQCLLSGRAVLVLENDAGELTEITMEPGVGYTILPYRAHRLVAIEDSEVVEVATPERGTTVRLADDYNRGDETEAVRALPDRGWEAAAPASA